MSITNFVTTNWKRVFFIIVVVYILCYLYLLASSKQNRIAEDNLKFAEVDRHYSSFLGKLKSLQKDRLVRGHSLYEGLVNYGEKERLTLRLYNITKVPEIKYLAYLSIDPGNEYDAAQLRLFFLIALVCSRELNRTLVLPDQIPATKKNGDTLILISDLFDMELLKANGVITRSELPVYLRDTTEPFYKPIPGFGHIERGRHYRWYEEDMITFLGPYQGIVVNVPYFICDDRSPLFLEKRSWANHVFRYSKSIQLDAQSYLTAIRASNVSRFVAIHLLPRDSVFYGITPWQIFSTAFPKKFHPSNFTVFIAGDLDPTVALPWFSKLGYNVVTKTSLKNIPLQNSDNLIVDATEWSVCNQSDYFIGTPYVAYDVMISTFKNQTTFSFYLDRDLCTRGDIGCFYRCFIELKSPFE